MGASVRDQGSPAKTEAALQTCRQRTNARRTEQKVYQLQEARPAQGSHTVAGRHKG